MTNPIFRPWVPPKNPRLQPWCDCRSWLHPLLVFENYQQHGPLGTMTKAQQNTLILGPDALGSCRPYGSIPCIVAVERESLRAGANWRNWTIGRTNVTVAQVVAKKGPRIHTFKAHGWISCKLLQRLPGLKRLIKINHVNKLVTHSIAAAKISFGGIPNSSSIILMPHSTTWAPFCTPWFCPCGQCYHQKVFKTTRWLPLTRWHSNKPHRSSPDPSEPCLRYLHQRTPQLSGNLPEPASGTYNSTRPNSPEPSGTCPRNLHYTSTPRNSPEPSGTCLRNLHHHTPELSGNLPEPPSGTYNSTRPNSPEPSGTCLRNLHHHTPELSGNLPEPPSGTYNSTRPNSPEPSGTCPRNVHYTSTHRNSPEPSGTCLRNLE